MPKTETVTAPTAEERLAAAIELLAASNAAIVTNTPIHRLEFDEWLALHPQPKMPYTLVLNSRRVTPKQLTKEQLALLGTAAKPGLQEGRFFNRRIHVWRDNTPDRVWHIKWPGKTMSDRMEMSNYGRDFTEILQRLTTETPDLT
jgi:hypothetical protein